MLIEADYSRRHYRIAVNNASTSAELVSDLAYLEDAPNGVLSFDFTHMAAPLTQERREEYLPGGFGYQPTLQLLEIVSTIAEYSGRNGVCPHQLETRLPGESSRVGRFLADMRLPTLLAGMGINVSFAGPATAERGYDDSTRQNLLPLTSITVSPAPNFATLQKIRARVERVFERALPDDLDLANRCASIVDEAIDNMIEYGGGGILGGLYYPSVGEVEITLVNRSGGFGGATPAEELDALVAAYEGQTSRATGGGNGITELSRLAIACFGTLLLRNGSATLRLLPDGSIVGTTEETGLTTPGAYVTLLLQLLPTKSLQRTSALERFEPVLIASLEAYARSKGLTQ